MLANLLSTLRNPQGLPSIALGLFTASTARRLLASLLLAGLILPSILQLSETKAKASTVPHPAPMLAPPAAPPEPFLIATPPATERLVAAATSVFAFFRSKLAATGNSAAVEPPAPPPPPPAGSTTFDFDGDGKADLARWHASGIEFKILNSNTASYSTYSIGSSAAVAAPADYDGDGKTDAAVFAGGTWTIKQSSNGSTQTITSFGQSLDIPVPGNYVGSTSLPVIDQAVFRPSTGVWYVRDGGNGTVSSYTWGQAGDVPVPGDYDGDGKTDFAVMRQSTGVWWISGSSAGMYSQTWGYGTDVAAPADYDGDNKTDIAIYRPSTATWYVIKSSNGAWLTPSWGNWGDQPVPADYDGDGKADFAVWRPTTGVWHILKSYSSAYEHQALGVAGDTAVESAYIEQVGTSVPGYDLAKARLSRRNATGGPDPYSQNFAWGTGLVGLPGRAGLDLGIGLSYNSLVWTKSGTTVYFDTNRDNVSPGFRFGFAAIEPVYYDSASQTFNYLMVTPSGGRVEFRQTPVRSVYETADSSYAQLTVTGASDPNDPVENITVTVKATDGTQSSYEWKGGGYRCREIKDRNGNFITVTHDDEGLLRTVTDTLGRVVAVNYDPADHTPSSITQVWKDANGSGSDTTHTWATFSYTTKTLDTAWESSLAVSGPPDGTVLKVLEKVAYADGSSTKFDYNPYGQVYKVTNLSAETTPTVLNYVRVNIGAPQGTQTDCPRFTETASWAKNFNFVGNTEAEVVATNNFTTGASYSLPGSLTASGVTKLETAVAGHPDGLYTRSYYGASGWNEGLPLATEDCTGTDCSNRKRWTWTDWSQDDTSASYIQNPRVIETRVGDAANVKKTQIDYRLLTGNVAEYGLASEVRVYAADLSTVIKKVATDYNLDTAYVSRRIIGLPSKVEAWGRNDITNSLEYVSKVTYGYDEENFTFETNQNISSVIRHDNANYSASFYVGRANPTSTTRWNVEYPTSSTYAVTSKTRYDIAGSVVAKLDPLNRKVAIDYTDSFNDTTTTRNAYAYPKYLTDPAGNSSTVKYRFDTGANVWAKSPNLNTNTAGKETTREFDSIGRISKETIVNSGTYTRYEYPTNSIQSKVYSTIIDTDSDGADADDEVLAESFFDGAGRVRMSRSPHTFNTNGTTANWAGTLTEYDILGRIKRQSVPTGVDSSWAATGDDYTRGFLWTYQKYDWKNRVVRKINTDGTDQTTLNDSDVLISYDGCGCAGGQVTTIEGENVVETDWAGGNPVTKGGRKQKMYEDILGRAYKTEVFEWDGATVYSTIVHSYNGRDQITNTRQYAGGTSSSTYRDLTMTYDGHARMKTRHYPIEDSNANTTWAYNADDSVATVTDPRGVVTNFSYYSTTGLLDEITYDVPSGLTSTVPDPGDVSFTYDNLGNRTAMTDGTGSASYTYNSLSQITAETKSFTGLSGTFSINYTYNLSGGVKTISDPQDAYRQAFYGFDKLGRTVSTEIVSQSTTLGTVYGTKFRAWGGVKEYQYNLNGGTNPSFLKYYFDDRLQTNKYEFGTQSSGVNESVDYTRYADGNAKKMVHNQNHKLDRSYQFDSAGRLTVGKAGYAANGDASLTVQDSPFEQTLTYNAYNEVTQVQGKHWYHAVPVWSTGSFPRTRDAAGNVVAERIRNTPTQLDRTFKWDAAGRQGQVVDPPLHTWEAARTDDSAYDGDGRMVRHATTVSGTTTNYEIRSTVLGGYVLGRWDPNVTANEQFKVPVNGGELTYDVSASASFANFTWTSPEGERSSAELDLRGADVESISPYDQPVGDGGGSYPAHPDATDYGRCAYGSLPISCSLKEKFDRFQLWVNKKVDDARQRQEDEKTKGSGTQKLVEIPGSAGFAASSSVPNATGQNDACAWSSTGNPTCYVEAEHSKSDPIDASAGAPDEWHWIEFPATEKFRELIKGHLNTKQPGQTKSCNDAIRELIAKVKENQSGRNATSYADDGIGLVNKINIYTVVNGGVNVIGAGAGGTVRGSIKSGSAEVLMSGRGYFRPVPRNVHPVEDAMYWWTRTAIHEILHLAGDNFSDGQLAKAAYDLGFSSTKVPNPDTNDINEILSYSGAFDGALAKFCGPRVK